MSSGGRGRGGCGGRGGSPPHKRARHDVEASSSRPPVEAWRSKQARERGTLSRSSGQRAWSKFDEIGEALWPTTKGLREAEIELHEAKEAFEAGEEGAAAWFEAAKEGYQPSYTLYHSAAEYYLNVKP